MKSMVRGACDEAAAREAARVIARGGVIIYPTDTLWGFGADPRNRRAIERVYAIKGREKGKPLLLMVRDAAMARDIARWPVAAQVLAEAFWPGKLTLVVPLREGMKLWGVGADGTVGVRAPAHPFRELFFRFHDFPITSTSVNRSGEPPMQDWREIVSAFGEETDFIVVDEENAPAGVPSTVLRVEGEQIEVVREGAVSRSAIAHALRRAGLDDMAKASEGA